MRRLILALLSSGILASTVVSCGDSSLLSGVGSLADNAQVTVQFGLQNPDYVHLRVVDEQDGIIQVLVDGDLEPGIHTIPWAVDGHLRVGQRFRLLIGTEAVGSRKTASYYFLEDGTLVAGDDDTPVGVIHMGTL
jgi:hypothetical protein